MNTDEMTRLETISRSSLYAAGVNTATIDYSFRIARRFLTGDSILEMGPAEGVMTEQLARTGMDLTLVEGAFTFCEKLRQRFPQAQVVHTSFEEFDPKTRFDNIILARVLEHVVSPVDLLSRAREWLEPGSGRLFAVVPNARSLHRQAAVIMGLLSREDELNEMDQHHGHRRVFDPETFRSAFHQAGLKVEVFGGYWIKPLSNRQIEEYWTAELLESFMRLGERYPDIAAEIYVVALAP